MFFFYYKNFKCMRLNMPNDHRRKCASNGIIANDCIRSEGHCGWLFASQFTSDCNPVTFFQENESFHYGDKHKDLSGALSLQWSNCLIQRESYCIMNWIIAPNFRHILKQIRFSFFCSCDLNQITGNWPTADIRPAVTLIWRHCVIP